MISAVVLAAGESRRMGVQKVLLPYAGKTVIERIVEAAATAVDEVVVVVGHEPERVETLLRGYPVKLVRNVAYREGMLSSVRAGIRALHPGSGGFMLLLGDQPQVRPELLRALAARFREGAGNIVLPAWGGRWGHPPLIPVRYRSEILHGLEETGLRGLYAAHPEAVEAFAVEDETILQDMDTPEDYARLLSQGGGG